MQRRCGVRVDSRSDCLTQPHLFTVTNYPSASTFTSIYIRECGEYRFLVVSLSLRCMKHGHRAPQLTYSTTSSHRNWARGTIYPVPKMAPRGAKSIYQSQFLKVARTPHFYLEFLRFGACMLRPAVQRADARVPTAIKMIKFTRNGEEPVSSHNMCQNYDSGGRGSDRLSFEITIEGPRKCVSLRKPFVRRQSEHISPVPKSDKELGHFYPSSS